MSGENLWKKYCSFYDKAFSKQLEYSNERLKTYFSKWKQTALAKKLDKSALQAFKNVPITTYSDYPMLHSFASKLDNAVKEIPRQDTEALSDYYLRI